MQNHSPNFYIGFDYPRTDTNKGTVYFEDEIFGSVWQSGDDMPGCSAGLWAFNRRAKACLLDWPVIEPQPTIQLLLIKLEEALVERSKQAKLKP
jgi:hypothetical protein